ncbi:hypothetical protein [Croceicoccus mobilis]|nr:hypothetical protein [Croceicoccus mobilis]
MSSHAADDPDPLVTGHGVQAQIWPVVAVMWGLAAIAMIAAA